MANPRNLVVDAYNSLSADLNKLGGRQTRDDQQGVVSVKIQELDVEMENADISKLVKKFEKTWIESDVYAEWTKRGNENMNYWKGKHFQRPETDKTRAIVDNVIFEAVETSLPQYIARNPEPDVELHRDELNADGSPTNPIGTVYVDLMQSELGDLGDEIKVRSKIKKAARFWLIYLLGAAKTGWDDSRKTPMLKAVRPRKLILDPDATIDEDGYTGELIGEYRKLPAHKLLKFATEDGAQKVIEDLVKEDLSTKLQFIEWWSDTTLVWTMGETVLMKRRNPHWNYAEEVSSDADSDFTPVGIAPEGSPLVPQMPEASAAPDESAPGMPTLPAVSKEAPGPSDTQYIEEAGNDDDMEDIMDDGDEEGEHREEAPQPAAPAPMPTGINHFPSPRKPYIFMVMFNLGDQPVDNTSLITQNLSNQDLINKRNKQIDKNADSMNNGLVVSLERSGLTAPQAKGVTEALRKGGVISIPAGSPQDAIWRPETPGLPADIYNNLVDLRGRVKGIMGVQGSTPQKLEPGQSVRGMVMNKTMDTDRIGGGISEVMEQFADDAYNWFVQIKLVYEPKYQELAAAGGGALPRVRVSVKEGSILPEDKVTLANQAIALGANGSMSRLDVLKALKYPNAQELAANAWLEQNAPDILYRDDPRVKEAVDRAAQAAAAELEAKHGGKEGEKGPSTSISFKDLPPDGKAQLAAKAGIALHAEGIAAHENVAEPAVPAVPGMAPGNV